MVFGRIYIVEQTTKLLKGLVGQMCYTIFVDLEMQEIERKNKKLSNGLRQEVIEFGAVVLDENHNEIDSFKSYVRPEYSSRMRQLYIDLTGITDSDILCADGFAQVLHRFCAWCQLYSGAVIYEWSDADLAQLLRESRKKNVVLSEEERLVLSNWQDMQRDYGDLVESNTQIALETAIWTLGEKFEGRMHDAVWDSRNTAKIYSLMQDEANVQMARQMLHHGTTETKISFTLADVFDFSKLRLAVG